MQREAEVHIFFDLDGTLTDPAVGITKSIQYALARLDRKDHPSEELKRFIGPPLRESFVELLHSTDESLLAEAIRLYREYFVPVGLRENTVYPEVGETLHALRQNHELWVVTSKPHIYAREIIEHFGLSAFFRDVYGSELSGLRADKGELIRHVLDTEHIAPADAYMVGDRAHDVLGARRNQVDAVGVTWGYGSREELHAAAPRHLVATMAELRDALLSEGPEHQAAGTPGAG